MSFISFFYLAYLFVVVLVHFLLPHKFRWVWLLAASYFFYGFNNPWLLFLIISVTLVTYLCALGIKKFERKKILFLVLSIVISLGSLFVFKYLDFAMDSVIKLSHLFGSSWEVDALNIILPVGISFYTFQALSYVVDVYKDKTQPEAHFGYYALFISYFPQLVAGPIERFDRLMPQLKNERSFTAENFYIGFRYILTGYIKKVVLADFLAITVNKIFNNLGQYDGGAIAFAAILFAFQIYGDFSGYSDIAKGSSKIMGIDLMENFDAPYLATSPRDFWRRWHISLSRWFGDYVYIPLGGNRKGKARQCLNLFLVFLLSGLWHGANLKFVVWGAIHGLFLIVETLLPKHQSPQNFFAKWSLRLLTFLLVDFAWIFFRANSLPDAGYAITKIFASWNGLSGLGALISPALALRLCGVFLALALCRYMPTVMPSAERGNEWAFLSIAFGVFIVGLSWALTYQGGEGSAFIYFQF